MLASALVRNPLSDLRRLERDLDWIFGDLLEGRRGLAASQGQYTIPVSLWADRERVRAAFRLPGVQQEDVDVSVIDNELTVRAQLPGTSECDDARWIHRERPTGEVARSVELPFAVDAEKVEARMENGVLLVDLPRPEKEKPRRIQISRAES